jgi:isopentenyl diphosphate isomerase/L-lactate dehydrogenase-like FMN-dependent dehydrogenase
LNLTEVYAEAKKRFQGICRVCRTCDGVVCAGEVPGMGGLGTGESFKANVRAISRYRLNLRTIHGVGSPDASLELFGRRVEFPALGAPVAGAKINFRDYVTEEEFAQAMLGGPIKAGTFGMSGDGAHPEVFDTGVKVISDLDGLGAVIIKPRDKQAVIDRIRRAEAAGALAVGVDIDAAGLVNMTRMGQAVGPKTPEELSSLVHSTKLPFILKGIMTPDEAELAVSIGAAAIVVSNHGGRALDQTPGTAEVLPEIAAAVKGKITILLDGGIRTGVDILKALTLGADAVLVGRPLAIAAFGGGAEGVALQMESLKKELYGAMILTGCRSVENVPRDILRETP